MSELLKVNIDNYIALVTLDNPPLNLMTPALLKEIITRFNGFGADERIKVVVLTGSGERAFCAGGDRRIFEGATPQQRNDRQQIWWDAERAIWNCGVPVIGAINGYAVGGGVIFAASCDTLFASEKAVFDIPEINAGVLAPCWSLRRMLPEMKLRAMAFSTQKLTAQEMFAFGSIEKVVPPAELIPVAMEFAKKIAEKDSQTLRAHKEFFNKTEYMRVEEYHRLVMDCCRMLPGIPNKP